MPVSVSVTEGLELVSLFIEASAEYLLGNKKIKTNVLYIDKMNNKMIKYNSLSKHIYIIYSAKLLYVLWSACTGTLTGAC